MEKYVVFIELWAEGHPFAVVIEIAPTKACLIL